MTYQEKARKFEKETSSEHDTIEKLQRQLDTLIKAKEEHETELITKVILLNTALIASLICSSMKRKPKSVN
jgi:hypothetical protein